MNKIKEFTTTHKKMVETVSIVILSWLGTCGICYLGSMVSNHRLSFSVFSFAIFVCNFLCLRFTKENIGR